MFWSCVLHEQGNSHHKTWKAFSFLCTIIMVLLFKEHCRDAFLPSHESDNTNASPERVLFRERKGPHHTRNSRSTSYVCTYIEKWQYIWLLSFVWYGHFRFMFCEQSGSKEIHSLESTKINHESINFSFRERLEVVERMKNKRNTQDCLNVTLNTLTVDREAPGKKTRHNKNSKILLAVFQIWQVSVFGQRLSRSADSLFSSKFAFKLFDWFLFDCLFVPETMNFGFMVQLISSAFRRFLWMINDRLMYFGTAKVVYMRFFLLTAELVLTLAFRLMITILPNPTFHEKTWWLLWVFDFKMRVVKDLNMGMSLPTIRKRIDHSTGRRKGSVTFDSKTKISHTNSMENKFSLAAK